MGIPQSIQGNAPVRPQDTLEVRGTRTGRARQEATDSLRRTSTARLIAQSDFLSGSETPSVIVSQGAGLGGLG